MFSSMGRTWWGCKATACDQRRWPERPKFLGGDTVIICGRERAGNCDKTSTRDGDHMYSQTLRIPREIRHYIGQQATDTSWWWSCCLGKELTRKERTLMDEHHYCCSKGVHSYSQVIARNTRGRSKFKGSSRRHTAVMGSVMGSEGGDWDLARHGRRQQGGDGETAPWTEANVGRNISLRWNSV